MGPAGVHEVVLYASDLPVTSAFYADVVGLRVVVGPSDVYAALRVGESGSVLLLFDAARSAVPGRMVPSHGTTGEGHVAFTVDEEALTAILGRCAAAGVTVERELDWPRGGRSVYVRDPAQNSVEFVVGPIWPD